MPVLELDGLTRHYGPRVALDSLSLTVPAGSVVGFLGPNGAGKTTAMRVVLGIVAPDAGTLRWMDSPVDDAARLRFGYMPEERGLYPTMKVLDQLIFLGRLHGMTRSDAHGASVSWLERLGIGDRADDRLDSLSMGNQQRVQMVAALVHEPDLLVLDEPFSGLDPTATETLGAVLVERARAGAAVMFSSHQLDLVEHLCERVVIIDKGRTVVEGKTADLTTSADVVAVEVEGDDGTNGWTADLGDQFVSTMENGRVRVQVGPGRSADAVLDAARRAGSVRHFGFERRRLSEVFREAVGA